MICRFLQILSIEMAKTNAERQGDYREQKKKIKEGSNYLEKERRRQENQGTFQKRIEGTKRSSKNESRKKLLKYPINKLLTRQWPPILKLQSHIHHHL